MARLNDSDDQFDVGFDRTDDRLPGETARGKVRRAADAAVHDHDEPADTGDRVGEATGGVAGAAAGAALGSLGGPIGTIIGGIAGAVGGWWTGRAVSEAAESFTDEDDAYYRERFEASRGRVGEAAYDRARPAYQLGYVAGLNPDYRDRRFEDVEPDLRRGWSGDERGEWSDVRDYARDAYDRGQERRLTLSEEELAIDKRQVQAGEVGLRKTVETERVEERVPVTHEEVVVDRRPLAADAPVDRATIGEDEVRVPLMKEELVVDKRVVPKEEVIVRKEAVTEDRTVSEELRRERLETDGLDDVNVRNRSKSDVRVRDDVRDELR